MNAIFARLRVSMSDIGRRSAGLLALLLGILGAQCAWAAIPTYVGAGTAQSGTGSVTPAWPTHQAGDIALLFVESTSGEAVTLSSNGAGFAAVANSPQMTTGGGTSGTRITVFWARATSSSMANPTVANPDNHVIARILVYRGVVSTGNPWDVTGGGNKSTASPSVTLPSVTTTVSDTRIVQVCARDTDSTSASFSNETNANLSSIVERADSGTTSGNGGGFAVWDGGKATAGAIGNTTATVTNSVNACLTIALKPNGPAVCTSTKSGNWNDSTVWDHTGDACNGPSGIPVAGDTVIVASGHTVTQNVATTPAIGSLTVSGTLQATAANTLTLGGNLVNNGSLAFGTSGSITLSAASQWSGAGATWTLNNLSLGNQALTFSGSPAISINGTVTVGSGTINAGGGNTTATLDFSRSGAQAVPTTGATYPNLTLSGSGAKTLSGGGTLDVRGGFTLNSGPTFNGGAYNVSLYGDFTNNGGANFNNGATDTGTWSFVGSSIQNINSTGINTVFPKLTLNNGNGIALNASTTVKTLLTLTNGYISTGSNILTLSAYCNTPSWARTSGFVSGNLRLTFNTGTTTCTYPIGSGTTYAPVGITMVASSAGGTLTARTTGSEHPQIATSGIDETNDANRYWTLYTAGDSTGNFSSYGATFNADNGDIDAGTTTSNFVIGKYTNSAWNLPTPVSGGAWANGWATGVSNISVSGAGFGDFIIGQFFSTCFTDNFNLANGSPGSNWSVGRQGGSFTPQIYDSTPGNTATGRLRLTDTSGGVSAWATLGRYFPGAGNKITVDFDHYAYGSTGGDGIAVILSDASIAPVAGAFGGSMGYAQKSNPGSDCTTPGGCPGFTGGWLGVALDEYGNFSTNTEGRVGGYASRVVESVSVRGSGSGMSGYRFLTGTSSLSPNVDGNGSANPPHHYRITVDHSDSIHAWLAVERATSKDVGGNYVYTTLLGCPTGVTSGCTAFDVKDPGNSQNAVPSNWLLSFTGSTGASTNIHEIDSLQVCTVKGIQTPSLHHIEIDHTGSACTGSSSPAAITVKACANAACDALYPGEVTVTLATAGNGIWSTNPVTISGGKATLTLRDNTAQSVTLGTSSVSPTAASSATCYNGSSYSCTLTFAACVFDAVERGASAFTPIYTKLAGTVFPNNGLDVVSLSGSSQTVRAVEIVDASSGSSCSAYTAPSGGATTTPGGPWTIAANGSATFAFNYANALRNARIRIRYGSSAPYQYACSSDNFAIRPQSFTLVSSASNSGNPPLGSGDTNTPIFRAGSDTFTLSATALSGYDGTPKLNLNNASCGSSLSSACITSTLGSIGNLGTTVFPQATLATGAATATGFTYSEVGNFSLAQYAVYDDGFTAVDSGKANPECTSDFSNTASSSTDYKYGCMFGSNAGGAYGRFIPDHFTVVGAVSNACETGAVPFSYMGQAFILSKSGNPSLPQVVEARNAADNVTANYSGATWGRGAVAFGLENADAGTNLTTATPLVFYSDGAYRSLGGSWVNGVYTLADSPAGNETRVAVKRPTGNPGASWGEFNALDIGVSVTDADVSSKTSGAIIVSADMNPATTGACGSTGCPYKILPYRTSSGEIGSMSLRYGRLRLLNAYGSELLDIRVPVRAEYYDSGSWKINTDDSCTALTNLGKTNGSNTIGLAVGATLPGFGASSLKTQSLTLASGSGILTMSTPGSRGGVDIALNLAGSGTSGKDSSCISWGTQPATITVNSPTSGVAAEGLPWLQYAWCSGKLDPNARITFGTPKGRYIYLRERY